MFEDWINGDVKSVLLVEPNFPIPSKSRNHKNFLPIGLLKIASLLRKKSIDVELVRHGFDDFDKNNVYFHDLRELLVNKNGELPLQTFLKTICLFQVTIVFTFFTISLLASRTFSSFSVIVII